MNTIRILPLTLLYAGAVVAAQDPFEWLEERRGEQALQWVQKQNERTFGVLEKDPRYARYREIALANAQKNGDIPKFGPTSALRDGWIYQLSQDEVHPRGLWRRAKLGSFVSSRPDWQDLLDIDALAKIEARNWLFAQVTFAPDGEHCLIRLNNGGDTTGVWREYDIKRRAFVSAGFVLPMSNQSAVAWKDNDTLLVVTDSRSSISDDVPTIAKLWSRGTQLSAAKEIFRGATHSDVSVRAWPRVARAPIIEIIETNIQGGNVMQTTWRLDALDRPAKMILPPKVLQVLLYKDEWVFSLAEDWNADGRIWKAGSLLSISNSEVTRPSPAVRLLMDPGPRKRIDLFRGTGGGLLVAEYENARGRLWRFTSEGGQWEQRRIGVPDGGTIQIVVTDPAGSTAFVTYEDFLQPPTLYAVDVTTCEAAAVKRLPAQFDASGFVTEQMEATSKDGTRVPYFLVRRKAFEATGDAPTLLYAYGGNNIPSYPKYSGSLGRLWLEQGGVYALANIRGGGEFAPAWHEAALKTKRQRSYDDFIAVAEDLIHRKISSSERLGIYGLSNGGLVMGVVANQRPDLFKAAILLAGVLDTIRIDLMPTGSRSVVERGSPDIPDERAFLDRTSPYQNLKKREHYPVPFLLTSTTDEVVHPAMTRKYAAKMDALGMPFFYYESSEGGHSISATPQQRAVQDALMYTYLAWQLIDGRSSPGRMRAGP